MRGDVSELLPLVVGTSEGLLFVSFSRSYFLRHHEQNNNPDGTESRRYIC
jgi:hypothetical protein